MAQTHDDPNIYYVPHHSPWPFVGSITLFITMIGVANWLNGQAWGQPVFFVGLVGTMAVRAAFSGPSTLPLPLPVCPWVTVR